MSIKVGDHFKIKPSAGSAITEWGSRIFIAERIQRQRVRGYDDNLDLGLMVVFTADFGRRGKAVHAVPVSWAIKVKPAKPRRKRSPGA